MTLTDENRAEAQRILESASLAQGVLSQWEVNFVASLSQQFEDGELTFISPKMWSILRRIEDKL